MAAGQGLSYLWDNLFRRRAPWVDEVAELWGQTPLFAGVAPREIRRLAATMHPRRYGAGEAVFRADDPGAGAAMILRGKVEIRADEGRVASLERGDFFGEAALVCEGRRGVEAIASESCELAFFLRLDLDEWLESAPRHGARLALNLAAVLAERLRRLDAGRRPGDADDD